MAQVDRLRLIHRSHRLYSLVKGMKRDGKTIG
jgi:hypothetical protein